MVFLHLGMAFRIQNVMGKTDSKKEHNNSKFEKLGDAVKDW